MDRNPQTLEKLEPLNVKAVVQYVVAKDSYLGEGHRGAKITAIISTQLTRRRERTHSQRTRSRETHSHVGTYQVSVRDRNTERFKDKIVSTPTPDLTVGRANSRVDKPRIQTADGIELDSKIEYIIWQGLREEKELQIDHGKALWISELKIFIHPDFTISHAGCTYYWEHLGMLDKHGYYDDWQRKKKSYVLIGALENLITTEDMGGINERKIRGIISDIKLGTLVSTPKSNLSNHHYPLY